MISRSRLHVWLALILIILTASCAPGAETVNVGAAHSGTPIDLRVGDTLVVGLESNPSTGFDWAMAGSSAPVLDLAERTYAPGGPALGAAGTVTYRFRAMAEGSTRLIIHYARSWESVPPERTFELTVRVRR